MTYKNTSKNIIKVNASKLDQIQKILVQQDFSLDEILNYENGSHFQTWSNSSSENKIVLDIETDNETGLADVVAELVDCWHELRAIKNALVEDELVMTNYRDPVSAHEQLMSKVRSWETELEEEKDSLSFLFNDNVDPALLGFYDLDEETRQALLQ